LACNTLQPDWAATGFPPYKCGGTRGGRTLGLHALQLDQARKRLGLQDEVHAVDVHGPLARHVREHLQGRKGKGKGGAGVGGLLRVHG